MVGKVRSENNDTRNDDIRSPLSDNNDEQHEDANATEVLEDSFPTPESTAASGDPSPFTNHVDHEMRDLDIEEGLHQLPSEELHSSLSKMNEEHLKKILGEQIDLEIRLKHREVDLINDEIGKCEAQMIALRKYYQVPPNRQLKNEPSDFTTRYASLLTDSIGVNTRNSTSRGLPMSTGTADSNGTFYRTRSTTSSLRPSSYRASVSADCIHRRTDGILVKLTCIECQRSNFSSAQGFLNHCRIAHTKEFTSQDAAALQCGEALPDSEQDEEGLQALHDLRSKHLDPSKSLNIKEINFETFHSNYQNSNTSQTTDSNSAVTLNVPVPSAGFSGESTSNNDPSKRKGRPISTGRSILKKKNPGHLILKLSKNGTPNEEIEKMLEEINTKVEVPDLYDQEESENDEDDKKFKRKHSSGGKTNGKSLSDLKRRKSRGGVGISQQSITIEKERNGSVSPSTVSPQSSSPSKPPLVLRLKVNPSSRSESPSSDNANSKKVGFDLGDPSSNKSDNDSRGREPSLDKLTPSQRRRLPSNASPSRTRSRGLK